VVARGQAQQVVFIKQDLELLSFLSLRAAAISWMIECEWDCFASLAMTDSAFSGLEMGSNEKSEIRGVRQ
jgi:hypothetical protein